MDENMKTTRFNNVWDAIRFLNDNHNDLVTGLDETTIAHNGLVKEFTALRTRVANLERLVTAQNRILQENGLVGRE